MIMTVIRVVSIISIIRQKIHKETFTRDTGHSHNTPEEPSRPEAGWWMVGNAESSHINGGGSFEEMGFKGLLEKW